MSKIFNINDSKKCSGSRKILLVLYLVLFFIFSSLAQEVPSNIKQKPSTNTQKAEASPSEELLNKVNFNNDSSIAIQRMIQNLIENDDKNILNISGFVDFNYSGGGQENSKLDYGQFEVDFSASFYDHVTFEAALALDGESIVPGAGYLDYHFSRPEERLDARGGFFNHSGIHIGQFDVPFGRYYEQIPSPSRKISTVPFVIQNNINCLNTLGVNVYSNYSFLEINTFILNGLKNGYILGGRAGFCIDDFLILGSSILYSFDEGFDDTKLQGLDVEVNLELIEISSELLWGNGYVDYDNKGANSDHFGYYVETSFLTSKLIKLPVNLILRYGKWKSEYELTDKLNNISHFDLTLDCLLHNQLILKLEQHIYYSDGSSYQSNYRIQTIISF